MLHHVSSVVFLLYVFLVCMWPVTWPIHAAVGAVESHMTENAVLLFPVGYSLRSSNNNSHYDILRAQMEQSGFPKNILFSSFHPATKNYELWYILPFSVSPPPLIIYKSAQPFKWVASSNLKHLSILNDHECIVFEQTDMRKGSLGSWHERLRFSITAGCDMCMDNTGESILVGSAQSQIRMISQSTTTIQRVVFNRVKGDFSMFPHSLSPTLLAVGRPYHNQTDGQVLLYKIVRNEVTLEFRLQHVLSCSTRASLFGTTILIKADRIFVSAPLAHEGQGCVYVYADQVPFMLVQTLTMNIGRPEHHFGHTLSVSDNGNFVLIGGFYRQIYIFLRHEGIYHHTKTLEFPPRVHPKVYPKVHPPNTLQSSICVVDNNGSVIVSDGHGLYCLIDQQQDCLTHQQQENQSKIHLLVCHKVQTKVKLREASPNRLRLRRRMQNRKWLFSKTHMLPAALEKSQILKKKKKHLFTIPEIPEMPDKFSLNGYHP